MSIDLSKYTEMLDKDGTGVQAMGEVTGPKLGDQADLSAVGDDQADASSVADNTDVDSDTEEKVPKSRFLKRDRELMEERHARELLAKDFQRLEAELEAVRSTRVSASETSGGMPKWWTESWGDSEQSLAAWKTYQGTLEESTRMAREQMKREEQAERQQRQQVEEAVSNNFDSQLEDLETGLGKSLTDKQAADLLGIVEEYSPLDENGNFESFISLDKAYEIYDLRQRGNRNAGKDHLSRISGANTQGNAAPAPTEAPPQWGDWRKRLGGG